jgi:Gpi16 subunit, GPI transamidase component
MLAREACRSVEGQPPASCRSDWTYGTLPREAVCTENLTPWLRLLPCRGAAGLSALLHGPTVFSSPYTSLTASLTASTAADGSTRLRLAQTLTLLLPEEANGGWSLRSLFGHDAKGACPLAARSDVHVRLPWDSAQPPGGIEHATQQLGLSVAPAHMQQDGKSIILTYQLNAAAPLQLHVQRPQAMPAMPAADQPALAVHRQAICLPMCTIMFPLLLDRLHPVSTSQLNGGCWRAGMSRDEVRSAAAFSCRLT